jgi:formate dehydrogenase
MTVGSVAAGRIGSAVLRRLKPFDVRLAYTDPHRLPDVSGGGLAGAGAHSHKL